MMPLIVFHTLPHCRWLLVRPQSLALVSAVASSRHHGAAFIRQPSSLPMGSRVLVVVYAALCQTRSRGQGATYGRPEIRPPWVVGLPLSQGVRPPMGEWVAPRETATSGGWVAPMGGYGRPWVGGWRAGR